MADNRFRLFRLPFLALCMIIDFYGPYDIIQLSLCSKRSLRVAKKCWKRKGKVRAYLCAATDKVINVYCDDPVFRYRFVTSQIEEGERTHNIRVGDAVVSSTHKKTETVTYWEDKIFGIGQIVDYIKYMFDEPIYLIDWEADAHPIEFINTIDSIMSRQESVEDCTLRDHCASVDDCLAHLLDNCKITGDLRIFGQLGPQFRHNWNIHLNGLHISNGSCFTFQNLTSIDCQALELYSSSLTSEDANQFLKHWQNGGSSRIRFASIMINSMNHDIVTSGIETVPLPQGENRSYPFMRNSTSVISVGLDIKRNDGTTGTIHLDRDSFGFGVDPIDVWNR